MPFVASIGDSFDAFFDAVGDFFGSLAAIQWLALFPALIAFLVYLTLRARASFNILRAAYPDERIQFRFIWGAYIAGYGFNAVVPARGGDIVRLFLTKTSVPNSSYPAVAAAFTVELIFDLCMAIPILAFAFTQGVFPKPPDFSKLPAFDLAFFAGNPQFTLFLITVLGIATIVAFALLSARVKRFWERVRQGLTILFDRRRYFREVFAVQFVGWLFRFTAFFLLLEAFNVGVGAPPTPADDPIVFAANIWPDQPPGMRAAVEAYFGAAKGLAERLTEIAAVALDVPPAYFAARTDRLVQMLDGQIVSEDLTERGTARMATPATV